MTAPEDFNDLFGDESEESTYLCAAELLPAGVRVRDLLERGRARWNKKTFESRPGYRLRQLSRSFEEGAVLFDEGDDGGERVTIREKEFDDLIVLDVRHRETDVLTGGFEIREFYWTTDPGRWPKARNIDGAMTAQGEVYGATQARGIIMSDTAEMDAILDRLEEIIADEEERIKEASEDPKLVAMMEYLLFGKGEEGDTVDYIREFEGVAERHGLDIEAVEVAWDMCEERLAPLLEDIHANHNVEGSNGEA